MHNGFREALEIRPRPDRGLLWFTMLLGVGAAGSVALADVPLGWKVPAFMLIAGMAISGLRRRLPSRSNFHVARAVLLADGRWSIFAKEAGPVSARLSGAWGARLGPVIALEWRCDDGRLRQAWLLERDLPGPVWRRLRVRLGLS